MNSQVSFLDGELSLIHIPLGLYTSFVQPILQLLLPQRQSLHTEQPDSGFSGLTAELKHGFLNVSVTPVECSIVCHKSWVRAVFEPVIRALPSEAARTVSLSRDSYVALCVISHEMDAGSRVVDLSSPLALAGIPIFFITTYYSDFILVPAKDRQSVVHALLARGFVVAENESSFVVSPTHQRGDSFPHSLSHSRGASAASVQSSSPGTPPPSNATELQARTFDLLRKRRVEPYIDPDLHLVHCTGGDEPSNIGGEIGANHSHRPTPSRRNTGGIGDVYGGSRSYGNGGNGNGNPHHGPAWVDTVDTRFYTCLVAALVGKPRFLAVTLAQDDPPSLLVDKSLLPLFGDSVKGDTEGDLVPIFLDLADFPFEATGIVSGVAGRLVQDMQSQAALSYLSTARAGAVILSSEQAAQAIEILRPLLEEGMT